MRDQRFKAREAAEAQLWQEHTAREAERDRVYALYDNPAKPGEAEAYVVRRARLARIDELIAQAETDLTYVVHQIALLRRPRPDHLELVALDTRGPVTPATPTRDDYHRGQNAPEAFDVQVLEP
ncbi:MAG: hypothetical protein QF786_00110 [Vicinamibacterales bacterium]|nr:hypothetical protein [Vicinamibacterales bacterium]